MNFLNDKNKWSVLYTDSIVFQARPNLHTLKTQQRKLNNLLMKHFQFRSLDTTKKVIEASQ